MAAPRWLKQSLRSDPQLEHAPSPPKLRFENVKSVHLFEALGFVVRHQGGWLFASRRGTATNLRLPNELPSDDAQRGGGGG
jgi:hypothetical protein